MTIYIVLYAIMNFIVFVLYGMDKWKATHKQWRIPEATLMIEAFFGVFGAVVGMHVFHHKTQKPLFSLGVPLIMLLEIFIYIELFYLG